MNSLFSEIIQALKVVSAILSTIFVVGIIISLLGLLKLSRDAKRAFSERFIYHKNKSSKNISPQKERWKEIEFMFKSHNPTSWRMAIIDADSMLEELIVSLGYKGGTLGDKLKEMQKNRVPWVQAAWNVHLLRNKLAHEGSHYRLTDREAYQAFKTYKDIFYKTGYLA